MNNVAEDFYDFSTFNAEGSKYDTFNSGKICRQQFFYILKKIDILYI